MHEIFLSETTTVLTGKISTQVVLSREIKVFLHLICIGLFGKKSAFLHLES
jgi:hypothetical protein